MTRTLRSLTLALAVLVGAFVAVPAATPADDQSTAQVVEAGTALFPDRAYVLTLAKPRATPLTVADVKVTEDGTPVKNLTVFSSASANGIGTVLLIDASNSMKSKIGSAMVAARAFAARNPGQPLSVVFFNSKPTVAQRLTTDSKQVAAALANSPKLAEGTAIYDALAAAVAQVRGSQLGAARFVLLSDGADIGSVTSLESALSQLAGEKIRVFTIGVKSPSFEPEDLEKIAEKTGGTYAIANSPGALRRIYDELGAELGKEYLIRYKSAARPGQAVDVNVALQGAPTPVSFSYDSPSAGTAAPYKPALRDKFLQSWLLIPLVVAAILALAVLSLRSMWSLRSNKALVSRLGDFVTLPTEEKAKERRKEVDTLLEAVGQDRKRQRNWRWLEGFSEDVDVAQIERDPAKMIWLSVFAGVLFAVVGGVLLGTFWILLGIVPPLGLNFWVRSKARRTRNDFAEQLPENLDVLASALRAGHSLAGAMGVLADEANEPSKREFNRVVTDEQLGIPLDEALEVTAKRMQNSDMDQIAILALVQREAGGNTAEVLDQVTANIRARMDIRRLVKVLTAQGKFSSVVVAMVPVGIFLFLMLVNPDHLDPLFHRTIGQIASVAAVLMVISGFYVIRRIVSIEL
ncbi:MAG TPA: type II secretion system F family protein [Gaiella sp.]